MARGGLAIRKNDTVLVIAGREKGKRGKVLFVLSARDRVIVERLNMVKRHQRPTQKLRQGGIIEREAPLHVSNVMLVCSKCDKATRVGVRVLADDRRARVCRRCGEIVDKG
jgi:large subunit ribosomal protein L24